MEEGTVTSKFSNLFDNPLKTKFSNVGDLSTIFFHIVNVSFIKKFNYLICYLAAYKFLHKLRLH